MKTTSFYAAAMLALSAAAFLPTQAMAQVGVNVVIGNAPPPPRYEAVPQARPGYVWAPGYWNWDGRRHVWADGHWESARRDAQYRRSEWVRDGDRWRLNQGGWVTVQSAPVAYDYVQVAPPPPRHERIPRPRAGYIWAPGHWEWRGNRHEWTSGVWIAERPGYQYRPATWQQRDGRWYMEQGRWSDRDHDGIPDRYDHHDNRGDGRRRDEDRDGIPNNRDHDRDGDGVPNRRDASPDNPRRN